MKNIGSLLIQARKEHNMTQGDLAEQLEVSRQTISKWENEERKPDLDSIYKLCSVLDLKIEDFNLPQRKIRKFEINRIWIYTVLSLVIGIILGYQISVVTNTFKISENIILNRNLQVNNDIVMYDATVKFDVTDYEIACIFENAIDKEKYEKQATTNNFDISCNLDAQENVPINLYIKMKYKTDERLFYEYSFNFNSKDGLTYKVKY